MIAPTTKAREALFASTPGLQAFIATMLEDAQGSEREEALRDDREERDTGTSYTLCDSTFDDMVRVWREFRIEAGPLLAKVRDSYTRDQAGTDLWLAWAGHRVDVRNRVAGETGERLYEKAAKVTGCGKYNPTPYFGDDGEVYLA